MTHVEAHNPYFFKQRKDRQFYRRQRKAFDSYSLYGERRETLLTFVRGETESVVSGGRWRRPSSAASVRPGTAARRVSILDPPVVLPAIDKPGPNLVTGDELEAVETKSTHSEKKLEFLRSVEEKEKPQQLLKGRVYKYSEAKFASSSILSNIAKHLEDITDGISISLPVELVECLLQDHQQLTVNVIVERREWQTDCYLDFEPKNRRPFLTGVPEEESVRAEVESSIRRVAKKQEKERNKRVKMSKEAVRYSYLSSPERPQTARSIISNLSFRSDVSRPSSADERESRYEYDILPADVERPRILHYRRESQAPKLKLAGPKTRLEKFRMQKGPTAPEATMKKKAKVMISVKSSEKPPEESSREKEEQEPPTLRRDQVMTTIVFSVASPHCRGKGWLVTPSELEDPEANTLLLWQKQLQEFLRRREEGKLMAKQRGEDGPLVVKFYNDPQTRTLRSKHQRSATFPLPAVLSKLPPSVASFSTPSANEALLVGEGSRVFILVLPDGSGYCNYYSGRQAMCMSRRGDGTRGLYTLVYDDREGNPLLAYFTASGWACCYHRNGSMHLLSNEEGGCLFDEEGNTVRKWVWPPPNYKLPVSVSIQLNANLSFQCSNLTNMVLRFSCRGHLYKFPLGPSPELIEQQRKFKKHNAQGKLLTDLPFTSAAALGNRRQSASTVASIPPARRGRRLTSSTSEDEGSGQWDNDRVAKELANYKDRIRTVVNNWMVHYRQAIGIRLPPHLSSSTRHSSSSTPSRLHSSHSPRAVQSAMGYFQIGETFSRPSTRAGRPRHLTHPLPSRTGSLLVSRSHTPPLLPLAPGTSEGPRTLSPSPLPHPVSPLDYIQKPSSAEQQRPFKVGISKPQKKHSRINCGCPVALHALLTKELDIMPPCKCDKRRPPYLSDLEYDIFLQSHVPRDQIVVVCVLSSIVENSCPCEPMLDSIHYSLNTIRFSPCTQCSGDAFRLVKYDVCRALRDLNQTTSLLVRRHNATPGMFLMYMGGQLVHADYMFNGYGTTKRDFMKQIQRCLEDGRRGHFLPSDYKFTRRTGAKIPGRNTWAYPLSGVLEDLVPYSPVSSGSGTKTSSQHSLMVDEFKLVESKVNLDFVGFSSADVLQLSTYSGLESSSRVSNLSVSMLSLGVRES